jgi:hypothetical protein
VSRVIVKVALENTLEDKMEGVLEDKKIQPKLEKEWLHVFSGRLGSQGLAALKEGAGLQRMTKAGKRLPYLQAFDILYYQAAATFQRYVRRDKSKKEVKLAALRLKKLKPLQEVEDEQGQKLQTIFETAKNFVDKQAYDTLITNFTANRRLRSHGREQQKLGELRSVSGCHSPTLKPSSAARKKSRHHLLQEDQTLFRFSEIEEPTRVPEPRTEVMPSIENFGAIGFFHSTNIGSESSSFSREESPHS